MGDDERGPTLEELAPWTEKWNYVPIFGAPAGPWRVAANWDDGYFRAADLIVGKVVDWGYDPKYRPMPGIEGVVGVYLFRHYLELALKHILFHSRWLKDQETNEEWNRVKEVAKTHSLQVLWDTIKAERVGKIDDGFWNSHDIAFVDGCITEFHSVDPNGETFRYHGPVFGVVAAPAVVNQLYISFEALHLEMKHVRDVLWSLDAYCLNSHGQNEEWEEILKSF